jgi:hypothetical protein
MYPSRLYKEICDTNMHNLGPDSNLFLLAPSAAPLGCIDGTSTHRNASARQARPLYVRHQLDSCSPKGRNVWEVRRLVKID